MKPAVVIIFILINNIFSAYSQNSSSSSAKEVALMFCNNSSITKQFSIISYAPNETGNATVQINLKPWEKVKQVYKTGTLLYLADKKQVNIVMSGKKLTGKPFKIISEKDHDKTINLIN